MANRVTTPIMAATGTATSSPTNPITTPRRNSKLASVLEGCAQLARFGRRGDPMGALYASLLPKNVMHALGEFYSPRWLAELAVEELGLAPGESFCDPYCGSGVFLMAASNAENRLVLATGNKSELSVGYCTLYGDTVGGLAVLGDVYKRDVYAIARHANKNGERVPKNTIDKPPSAELAPDQLDSDDLPPYEVLDTVLEQAIEGGLGAAAIQPPEGVTPDEARAIVRRLDRNEYKRRQSPLVLRVSPKAFGTGRRLPIVHRYSSS